MEFILWQLSRRQALAEGSEADALLHGEEENHKVGNESQPAKRAEQVGIFSCFLHFSPA